MFDFARSSHPTSSASSGANTGGWVKMDNLSQTPTNDEMDTSKLREIPKADSITKGPLSSAADAVEIGEAQVQHDPSRSEPNHDHPHDHHNHHYRVYKRRWFGLVQLVLLNIIISWDWLTFAAISTTSAEYFDVSATAINWLSTGFLFSFCVVTPLVIWTLHMGPKPSIMAASVLTLVGNWIRYGGTRASGQSRFGVVLFGQILVGFAQPFVLAAPTRYSDMWFTDRGRVSATALASLANPLGGALGQLISPLWATKADEVPNSVLYLSAIATVVCLPSFFLPAAPPTPPSASSGLAKTSIPRTISLLIRNPSFWLLFIPFSVYVGLFNAISSLLNQILEPYGFSEEDAGITGALLILVGLVAAAILSPIVDRNHHQLTPIKILVPIIGITYLAFLWAPGTRTVAAPYAICSIMGASSFALVPIVLEYLVEVTWPASPEVGSVVCWAGGQLLGAIFIIIMGELKDAKGEPEGSMKRALIFQAVLACAFIPLPLCLGVKALGLGAGNRKGRLEIDEAGDRGEDIPENATTNGGA